MTHWKKGVLWGLATIALSLVVSNGKTSAGQSTKNSAPATTSGANNTWPEVNLNVVVLDKKGAPQNISGSEIHVFEDGTERSLQSFAEADSPVSIGFLVDTSGSMYRQLSLQVEFIKAVAHALPVGSEIMVAEFADLPRFVLAFTPISDADLILPLKSRGSSAMFDAVIATENYFADHAHNPKRALVLLSDGMDTASVSQGTKALRSLLWPGAPTFYSLFLPNQDQFVPEGDNRQGYEVMDTLAKTGGGIASTLSQKTELASAANLVGIIRSQQILKFTAADPMRNGKGHKLDLRHSNSSLRILALPVYYAPAK